MSDECAEFPDWLTKPALSRMRRLQHYLTDTEMLSVIESLKRQGRGQTEGYCMRRIEGAIGPGVVVKYACQMNEKEIQRLYHALPHSEWPDPDEWRLGKV